MKQFRDEVYKSGGSLDLVREFDGQIYMAIGEVCVNCDGSSHDYAHAAQWYRKTADLGDVEGQFKLGQLYAKGEGLHQDMEEAYYWTQLSTSHGDPEYIQARDEMGAQLPPERIEVIKRRAREWKATYKP